MLKIIEAKNYPLQELNHRSPPKGAWEKLLKRKASEDRQAQEIAQKILDKIQEEGLAALCQYSQELDKTKFIKKEDFLVTEEEQDRAEKELSPSLKKAFDHAFKNIYDFHVFQKEKLRNEEINIDGTLLGFRYTPLENAGIYVPGGLASYPSSALMGLIPAYVAGVSKRILITPPSLEGKLDPALLYCARLAKANQIIKAGGAHGIASVAFGLFGSAVDIIVGPGNRYVTAAKLLLASRGKLGIDMPAGPSEVLIIADESAQADFVASDLLSQAEHGSDSSAVLLTRSRELAEAVQKEISRGIEERPLRQEMKQESIEKHSYVLIFENEEDLYNFANLYAPEHLELCTKNPKEDLEKIKHAGSVFLGHYAPVALGDYCSGSNHILPTGGASRFCSGLGLDHFLKRITYQYPSKASLQKVHDPILAMSKQEGFDQEHGHSVTIRFSSNKKN